MDSGTTIAMCKAQGICKSQREEKVMKRHLLKLVVFFGVLALAAQAQALAISPGTEILSGPETSQNDINDVLDAYFDPDLVELYKQDAGGPESGPLAGSYTTTFNGDLSGGTIVYNPPGDTAEDAFLLVKDGAQDPAWYLFDLSGWDGEETITLSGFWPGEGAISHVTLYGGTTTVPEPGTLLLLGSGLFGLALYGRKSVKR
jgi:hypothetical protein